MEMNLDLSMKGAVSMTPYYKCIISEISEEITSTVATPASEHLLMVSKLSEFSQKQKLNAKSSIMPERVGLGNSLPQMLWS